VQMLVCSATSMAQLMQRDPHLHSNHWTITIIYHHPKAGIGDDMSIHYCSWNGGGCATISDFGFWILVSLLFSCTWIPLSHLLVFCKSQN
jgi:hypothetical protein